MDSHGAPAPSWIGLAWTTVPLLAVVAILAARRLGQVSAMLVAAARMAAQLFVLGLVLEGAFSVDHPWVLAAAAGVMIAASSQAVGARQSRRSWSIYPESAAAMALGGAMALAVASRLALGVAPWFEPSVMIPLMGMILGNSVHGVALAADRFDAELCAEVDLIERRLALGASIRQATAPARLRRRPGRPDAHDQRHDRRRPGLGPRHDDRPVARRGRAVDGLSLSDHDLPGHRLLGHAGGDHPAGPPCPARLHPGRPDPAGISWDRRADSLELKEESAAPIPFAIATPCLAIDRRCTDTSRSRPGSP